MVNACYTFPMRPWKIASLVMAAFIVFGLGVFGYAVYREYREITSGVPTGFTRSRSARGGNPSDLSRLFSKDAPSLGKPGAPVTIIEFLDFSCPFSRASFEPIRSIVNKYRDQVFFVVRDFPILDVHPRAAAQALAARCAQVQGRFWPFHDWLFSHQDFLEDADFKAEAASLGLDQAAFDDCFARQTKGSVVAGDVNDGLALGVAGTPTFFVNGYKIEGEMTKEKLEKIIQGFLKIGR